MESHEAETIIRHLVAIAAHQDVLNDKHGLLNQRLITAMERLDTHLASIDATLKGLLPGRRTNGQEETP